MCRDRRLYPLFKKEKKMEEVKCSCLLVKSELRKYQNYRQSDSAEAEDSN